MKSNKFFLVFLLLLYQIKKISTNHHHNEKLFYTNDNDQTFSEQINVNELPGEIDFTHEPHYHKPQIDLEKNYFYNSNDKNGDYFDSIKHNTNHPFIKSVNPIVGQKINRRLFPSPLNRVVLSIIAPRLLRFQFDMMVRAIVGELLRKFIYPVFSVIKGIASGNGPFQPNGNNGNNVPLHNPLIQQLQQVTNQPLVVRNPMDNTQWHFMVQQDNGINKQALPGVVPTDNHLKVQFIPSMNGQQISSSTATRQEDKQMMMIPVVLKMGPDGKFHVEEQNHEKTNYNINNNLAQQVPQMYDNNNQQHSTVAAIQNQQSQQQYSKQIKDSDHIMQTNKKLQLKQNHYQNHQPVKTTNEKYEEISKYLDTVKHENSQHEENVREHINQFITSSNDNQQHEPITNTENSPANEAEQQDKQNYQQQQSGQNEQEHQQIKKDEHEKTAGSENVGSESLVVENADDIERAERWNTVLQYSMIRL